MDRNNFINKVVIGKEQLEQWLQNNPNYLNVSVIQDQVGQSDRVVIGKAQLEQWRQSNVINPSVSAVQNRDVVSDNNNSNHKKCLSGKFLKLKRIKPAKSFKKTQKRAKIRTSTKKINFDKEEFRKKFSEKDDKVVKKNLK